MGMWTVEESKCEKTDEFFIIGDEGISSIRIEAIHNKSKAIKAPYFFNSKTQESLEFELQQEFGFNKVYGDLILEKVAFSGRDFEYPDTSYANLLAEVWPEPTIFLAKRVSYLKDSIPLDIKNILDDNDSSIKISSYLKSKLLSHNKIRTSGRYGILDGILIDILNGRVSFDTENKSKGIMSRHKNRVAKRGDRVKAKRAQAKHVSIDELHEILGSLYNLLLDEINVSRWSIQLREAGCIDNCVVYIQGMYDLLIKANGIREVHSKVPMVKMLKENSHIFYNTIKQEPPEEGEHNPDKSTSRIAFAKWAIALGKKLRLKGFEEKI